MDNETIDQLARRYPEVAQFYAGCFPADMIPHMRSYPKALIANTDPSDSAGTHWLVLFARNASEIYYFDPFGEPPLEEGPIYEYLCRFKKIVRNRCKFQPTDALTCGAFAVFVLYHLCAGDSFERVLSRLCKCADPNHIVKLFIGFI